jgi:hypothetical protein
MADKDMVALIKKHDDARPGLLYRTVDAEGLAAGVRFLVEDYRKVAELYGGAAVRGGKALQAECRTTANKLALLLRGVEQAASAAVEPTPAARPAPERTDETRAAARAEHESLEVFVNEQAAKRGDGPLAAGQGESAMFELMDPARPARDASRCPECDEAADSGDACGHRWHGAPESSGVAYEPLTPLFVAPAVEPGAPSNMPPALMDPAAAPELEDPGGQIPGKRVTWGVLTGILDGTSLEDLGLPEHVSHSQMETLRECGTKYVMQRSETLGVVEVPQWALVGGKAFHAAAEWFERTVLEVHVVQFVKDRLTVAGGIGELWRKTFGQTITDEAVANPLVPVSDWRGARKGAEGYTWWLVEGEAMLARYIGTRLAELDFPVGGQSGWRKMMYLQGPDEPIGQLTPAIEHEFVMNVMGVADKGVIDQAWEVVGDEGPMRAGDLLIDDLKSGRTVPVETGQLEEYAMWLSRFGGGENRRIWGRFYDARKGTYTEPVDLLERASWERFAFEVAATDRQKRAGIFAPSPSSFCGGCSVKHACPIFALAGS